VNADWDELEFVYEQALSEWAMDEDGDLDELNGILGAMWDACGEDEDEMLRVIQNSDLSLAFVRSTFSV